MTPQHLVALGRANEYRYARAAFRHALKDHPRDARDRMTELVMSPPDWALTWAASRALMTLPNMGVSKVGALLKRAGVGQFVALSELTDRQRRAVCDGLPPRQPPGYGPRS